MKNLFLTLSLTKKMEFDPIDHLICTMANKRKTTLQELLSVTKENEDILTNLINYGISKNILSKTVETSYKLL